MAIGLVNGLESLNSPISPPPLRLALTSHVPAGEIGAIDLAAKKREIDEVGGRLHPLIIAIRRQRNLAHALVEIRRRQRPNLICPGVTSSASSHYGPE